jgi:hypothetical protein
MFGSSPVHGSGRCSVLAPKPIEALETCSRRRAAEKGPRPAVADAGVLEGERDDSLQQSRVVGLPSVLVALSGARLPEEETSPALGHAQRRVQVRDASAEPCRA